MFSTTMTEKYTQNFLEIAEKLRGLIDRSDAILVGIGAGMSASAGFDYSGKRFSDNFSDFQEKYGIEDMYSGGFYPFGSLEEYWAWWSRMIKLNRYDSAVGKPYLDLLSLIAEKNYFVLTTNVDHQVQKAGFDKERLFYTQGDYGLWQCSLPCHSKTYDNKETVISMVEEQRNMKVPSSLVPHCPVCGRPMSMNLRSDDTFVEDEGWYEAAGRYEKFLNGNINKQLLLLELGVGYNTPGIIKYPFWQIAERNRDASYVCINDRDTAVPRAIEKQSVCVKGDIGAVLKILKC